ncbi:hypothetical protein [Xanthomonas graminis]|uniref:hypothetical protein n=1 Tax=Xanthomonas graminis TaxID=3390026 RepID=UPI0011877027|nr:hypothetical protein [Xanthomonas translucens]UKE77731.1 hypothetical protein KM317_00195 [Xanthomonas translucens pv. arrhenatheri]
MLIQEMQNYLGERNTEEGKIRFPYGFIRTANHFRMRVAFIDDQTLRSNIAYTLILSDVLRWALNRMHVVGTAKEMLAKQIICVMGGVVESTTKHYLRGQVGAHAGYKVRTAKLAEMGAISQDLKNELEWLWDTRMNEHLFLVGEREYQRYSVRESNRAVRAFRALRDSLETHHANAN